MHSRSDFQKSLCDPARRHCSPPSAPVLTTWRSACPSNTRCSPLASSCAPPGGYMPTRCRHVTAMQPPCNRRVTASGLELRATRIYATPHNYYLPPFGPFRRFDVQRGHPELLAKVDAVLCPCQHHCDYMQRWGPAGMTTRPLFAADYHYFHSDDGVDGRQVQLPPAMRPWEPTHRFVTLVSRWSRHRRVTAARHRRSSPSSDPQLTATRQPREHASAGEPLPGEGARALLHARAPAAARALRRRGHAVDGSARPRAASRAAQRLRATRASGRRRDLPKDEGAARPVAVARVLPCYSATLLLCHPATLPPCHPATLRPLLPLLPRCCSPRRCGKSAALWS